ncbi:hypothetical protein D915_010901 [Fasciola hepatica]|uniref:Uncharacterized protein n=1 Tax=Fasciola hepatica TaxID=6192 RepID=A0A4E0QV39_FASHE|nr:hypothetical protein D915_010901 [Fasciola hepatica]
MLLRETNPENRAKIKQALHLLRQREASARDRAFRNKKMKQLQNEQIEILQSGKRVKFLRREATELTVRQNHNRWCGRRDQLCNQYFSYIIRDVYPCAWRGGCTESD